MLWNLALSLLVVTFSCLRAASEGLLGAEEALKLLKSDEIVESDEIDLATVVAKGITTKTSTTSNQTTKSRKPSPAKNLTIFTTVSPPTGCSTDGCCPKSPVTVTVTNLSTSTESFIYTVTETIDVTVFRGVTETELSVATTTSKVTLVSTVSIQRTITTTSFLTTVFPIERTFSSTVKFFTPAVRTVQRNLSITTILLSLSTDTIETVITAVDNRPATQTQFVSVQFTTIFETLTQTIFNQFTVAVATSYRIFRYVSTDTEKVTNISTRFITVPLRATATLSVATTSLIPTLTLPSTTILLTTAINYVALQDVQTTLTFSRIL